MEFIKKTLLSRKFIVMFFGVGLAISQGDYNAAYLILAAYIGVVGATEIMPKK